MATELPLASIPALSLHDGLKAEQVDAGKIVGGWLSKLARSFEKKSFDDISGLFIEDCWWRDIVGLNWDFSTKHGQESIGRYLSTSINHLTNFEQAKSGGLQPSLMDMGGLVWVQGGFTFKHPHGEGQGLVRLTNVGLHDWKAWIVFTQLLELDFHKELQTLRTGGSYTPAANGVNGSSGPEELQVLIIGAGQSGLALGARLQSMGIKTLLVDKCARVGDSWRARYANIKSHTPTYTDHFPYMRIPENWPRFLGRDQIADFMEHYSKLMGLDILLNSTVTSVKYNEQDRRYSVDVRCPEGFQEFTPRHVVLASGILGETPTIPDIPGRDSFQGQLYHTKDHRSAGEIPHLADKKVVVIGAGCSGHDVAHDFVTHGARSVALVQRSATFSVSLAACEAFLLAPWNTPGTSTAEADVLGNSFPLPVTRALSVGLSQGMCAHDAAMVAGLQRAGMAVRTGADGVGLAEFQLVAGGQFHLDQGANDMIIDGRIRILRCEGGVRDFHARGLTLADGTVVDADVIVLATGFQPIIENVRKVMGEEVVRKMPDFGSLDLEQERLGMWRQTGVPGFWYMTGSFIWCRQFSQTLAMQIAAVEKGFDKTHYEKSQ